MAKNHIKDAFGDINNKILGLLIQPHSKSICRCGEIAKLNELKIRRPMALPVGIWSSAPGDSVLSHFVTTP